MKRRLIWGAVLIPVILVAAAALLFTPDRPRQTLESQYLRAPGDLVTISGVLLHLRDEGPRDAPAVILLHGLGSSLHSFDGWADVFAKDFRVIRFDLPGAGLSGPDPLGDYSDERSIAVIAALMDHLRLQAATLAGNSLGGRLAWRFAAAQPDRVARLVLISPDGFASPGFDYGKPPAVPALMDLMQFTLPKWALRSTVVAAYATPLSLTDAVMERYHALLLAPGNRAALLARMRQTVLVDPVPLLRTIKVPVLLVWGGRDAMIPIRNAQDYLAELPDGNLIILPDLGHVPQEEDPGTSLRPVLAFLER